MSDVVAVALITGSSTAAVGIASGLIGVCIERIRSRGETDRLRARLAAEDARTQTDIVREGRKQAVSRLRGWIERQLVLLADTSIMITVDPLLHGDLGKLIDERLAMIKATLPHEASINTILSQFSDSTIVAEVRRVHAINDELTALLNSDGFRQAIADRRIDDLRELWKPIMEHQTKLDDELAALNLHLEAYLAGAT